MKATMGTAALTIATLAAVTVSAQPADDLKARVASVKQSLVASQKAIKGDEWIEMTIFSFKGEEKSRLQNRCYHGADGKPEGAGDGSTRGGQTAGAAWQGGGKQES